MATTSNGLLTAVAPTTSVTQMAPSGYGATTGTAEGYKADQWTIDPNQTVQGQVNNIVAKDSPLMQQAATTAKQGMAQRGLLNSSMAVGAGQSAVIGQALPMAQQDANTYAQSAQQNADWRNQANQFNTNWKNQFGAANMEAQNRANEFTASAQNTASAANMQAQNQFAFADAQQKNTLEQMATQLGMDITKMDKQQVNLLQQMLTQQQYAQANTRLEYELDTAQKTQLAGLSSAAAEKLANIEAQYKNLNQTSQSASSIMNTTMQAIARIMEDTSLDATAKQKAIDIYNANAETSLNLIAALNGDVDLTDFISRIN